MTLTRILALLQEMPACCKPVSWRQHQAFVAVIQAALAEAAQESPYRVTLPDPVRDSGADERPFP